MTDHNRETVVKSAGASAIPVIRTRKKPHAELRQIGMIACFFVALAPVYSQVPGVPLPVPQAPQPQLPPRQPRPRVVPPGGQAPAKNLTLKIDKQLMGSVDTATLKAARYGDFTPGQRYVVGLVKTETGWEVSQASPWFDGKDEAEIAAAIKEFPLQATLLAPAPEIPIDTNLEWQVKVKNTGKIDLDVRFHSLWLTHATPGLTSYGAPPAPSAGPQASTIVKAGGEAILSRNEKLYGPANWKFFGPQAWPLDYKARAILSFSEIDTAKPPPAPGAALPSFTAKSDWIVGKAVAPPAK